MQSLVERISKVSSKDIFWAWELRVLTKKSGAALYMAISRALKSGELEALKPGLYCFTKPHRRHALSPSTIGAYLCKNAYLSLESALSFAGLIPEAVQTHYFGTTQRAKVFENSFGRFHFIRIPASPFFDGVLWSQDRDPNSSMRVASPLRAVADLCYHRELIWPGIEAFTSNYRIDLSPFQKASKAEWASLKDSYSKAKSVVNFLNLLQKDIGK